MPTTSLTLAGKKISTEVFDPSGTHNGALIVIGYGSDGLVDNANGPWARMIRDYAQDLARLGFMAWIPDYLAATGTTPGPAALESISQHRAAWQAVLADAISVGKRVSGVDGTRIGLLGFSLGGHLCLRVRAGAKILVVFFAPELATLGGIGNAAVPTPQVDIHHGSGDELVKLANATSIERQLTAEGSRVTLYAYKDAGHGFATTTAADAQASSQSKARTLALFAAQL